MNNISMINNHISDVLASSKSQAFGSKINPQKAEESAESFEAFFMTRMMESMFEGVSTDGIFGGGHAEKIYRSLLLEEYGKEMAKLGSIGVKDYVMQSILQMQEAQTIEQNI